MSETGNPIGLWAGRLPLTGVYGEASFYMQCSRAVARRLPEATWLLTGRESRADRAALEGATIPGLRPRVPWPPRRMTTALRVPRVEWQYPRVRLVHYWSSTAAPATRLPYVLTILDGIALAQQFGEHGDVREARRLAHGARAVMTLTWESAELVGQVLGIPKLDLVPIGAGVDPDRFAPIAQPADQEALARHRLDPGYILYIGGWAPRKGLDVLAQALGLIDAAHRPRVVLTGTPRSVGARLATDLRALGAQTLGYVSDGDVPALLRHAGALVLPSRAEGFGLPVIEAQACGTPVVASDLPVIRSVSGGHAALFRAGDSSALARALVSMRQLRDGLSESGINNARRFGWDAVADRVLSVYARSLEASANGARAQRDPAAQPEPDTQPTLATSSAHGHVLEHARPAPGEPAVRP